MVRELTFNILVRQGSRFRSRILFCAKCSKTFCFLCYSILHLFLIPVCLFCFLVSWNLFSFYLNLELCFSRKFFFTIPSQKNQMTAPKYHLEMTAHELRLWYFDTLVPSKSSYLKWCEWWWKFSQWREGSIYSRQCYLRVAGQI